MTKTGYRPEKPQGGIVATIFFLSLCAVTATIVLTKEYSEKIYNKIKGIK